MYIGHVSRKDLYVHRNSDTAFKYEYNSHVHGLEN